MYWDWFVVYICIEDGDYGLGCILREYLFACRCGVKYDQLQ